MPNKTPWLAPGCRRHAFASLRSKEPVPTFYKCPIWHKMSLAVSLKVLVQTPSSNVSPFQVLNDPNDAFQIVSSRITFGGNGGLCFINSTGNRRRKKTNKLESHMHGLILLYCHTLRSVFVSQSRSRPLLPAKQGGSSCSTSAPAVCFSSLSSAEVFCPG